MTEFIDAIKVNEVEKLKQGGFSLYDIDWKICEVFAHQIFKTKFVHADPHPGNSMNVLMLIILYCNYIVLSL